MQHLATDTPRRLAACRPTRLITRAQALAAGLTPATSSAVCGAANGSRSGVVLRHPRASGRPRRARRPAAAGGARRVSALRHDYASATLGAAGAGHRRPSPPTTAGPRHRVRTHPGPVSATASSTTMPGSTRHERADESTGSSCSSLARTAVDIAREHGLRAGVVRDRRGVDSAACRSPSCGQPREPMWHWPFVTRRGRRSRFSDPRAESIGESLARILLDETRARADPDPVRDPRRAPSGPVRPPRRASPLSSSRDWSSCLRCDQGGVADRTPSEVVAAEKAATGLALRLPPRHVPHHLGRLLGRPARARQGALAREYAPPRPVSVPPSTTSRRTSSRRAG